MFKSIKNNENPIEFDFINLQEVVANRATKQLWGNGFVLSSETPSFQEKIKIINKDNKLFDFFYQAEKALSVWGVAIISIDLTMDKLPLISLNQPYGQSRVARIEQTELAAEVWTRLMMSDNSPYLHSTYSKNKITHDFVDRNNLAVVGPIRDKIEKKYQLPPTVYHNYGFIPVMFLNNLPKKNFFGGSNIGSYYPDNSPVAKLQSFLDATTETIKYELKANRTRIFGSMSQQELARYRQNTLNGQMQLNNAQLVEDLFKTCWIQSDMGLPGENSKSIEIMKGEPTVASYMQMLDWIIDSYFKGCGYSGDSQGSKQQTAFELTVQQSDDVETTRVKRTLRQSQYKRMFDKIFIMLGESQENIDQELYSFEIKENIIVDRDKELERQRMLLQLQLTTRARAIKDLYGVSSDEAEKIIEEINSNNSEDEAFIDSLNNDPDEDEEEGEVEGEANANSDSQS